MKNSVKNSGFIILSLVVFITLITGFLFLGRRSFLFDEIYSLVITRNWHNMWQILINQEGNMWFYYLLLHFWGKLGETEFIIRSLSVIFAALTIPLVYILGKTLFEEQVGKLAAILLPVNIFFIYYTQEVRGYTLLLFLTTLAAYLLIKYLQTDKIKYLLGFTISSILGFYTHLYAGLYFLAYILSLTIYGRKKNSYKRLLSGIIVFILCLLPLILSPAFRSHQIDWIQRPDLSSLFGVLAILGGDVIFLFLIYSSLLYWTFFLSVKQIFLKTKLSVSAQNSIFVETWLIIPIMTAFIFSLFAKPVYQSIYFLPSIVPFIILVSLALTKLRNKLFFNLAIISIFAFSAIRLFGWYTGNQKICWIISNRNEEWREAASFVSSQGRSNDAVIFYAYFARMPFEFYFSKLQPLTGNKSPDIIEVSSEPYLLGGGKELPDPNIKLLQALSNQYSRIWLVLNNDSGSHLDRENQKNMVVRELKRAFIFKQQTEYYLVKVLLFEKKTLTEKSPSISLNNYDKI